MVRACPSHGLYTVEGAGAIAPFPDRVLASCCVSATLELASLRNSEVEEVLRGSFDLHVHAAPDPFRERRMDAMDAARAAYEAGMRGFVLKSHDYPTAPLAYALSRMYPGLEVGGAVVLDEGVGGLNPSAVRVAAGLDARVVWMPTFSADFYRSRLGQVAGISLWGRQGGLRREVLEIVDIVAERGMTLASGWVSPEETIELFSRAVERGVSRMMATAPAGVATLDQLRSVASLGAYVEYAFLACMPSRTTMGVADLAAAIREVGADRCVLTTGLGQPENPPPAEGMRMAVASLLQAGLSAAELTLLVKDNPLRLAVEQGSA